MKHTVTFEQQKVLDTIRAYVALHGGMPSMAFIQKRLGYKFPSAAQHHVSALREKGLLKDITDQPVSAMRDIPLVGGVSCGPALLAEENLEGLISYPISKLRHKSDPYFFLRARGDSMDKAGINDGDILLVHQQQNARPGEKVIALLGDDATCKILGHTADGLPKLIPSSTNPDHKPRIMLEDFSVLGVVEAIINPERRAYDYQ